MTPAEIDVPHALVHVLEEAGIEFVFGMPGGDTGRIFDALYDSSSIRTILVRFENPELLDADRQAFLQIDVEPLQIGRHYPVSAAIVADAREALDALAAEIEARLTPAHREAARRRREHLVELKELHCYYDELAHALDRVRDAQEPLVLDVVTTEHAPFWQVQSPLAKEGAGGE